jgi:pantoate--beta-alanine ligase
MHVLRTIAEVRRACSDARSRTRLGLVPTMGALHEGHLSLVRRAREKCGCVAASIFVNPLQFAAGEDLDRYPRQIERDLQMLEAAGVDLVFAPPVAEMYPSGGSTSVDVGEIGDRLDGAGRPGHFRGVATVVAKLFHIVAPDAAYFGQKDAVQLAVLRRMTRDLNFGIELIACPTVRDVEGLALSSRNAYLSEEERRHALALPRALAAMRESLAATRDPALVLKEGRMVLASEPGVEIEYVEAVDAQTLAPVSRIVPGTLVAGAIHVGTTRLIDNFLAE